MIGALDLLDGRSKQTNNERHLGAPSLVVALDPLSVVDPLVNLKGARNRLCHMEGGDLELDRLSEFVRADYARVVAAVAIACGSERAEDAVQDALAKALQHRNEIHSLRAWVTRVALNNARTHGRRRSAERRAYERVTQLRPRVQVVDESLSRPVANEVRDLPRRQREIVALHYLLDMSITDVADVLAITEGTVKTHLHRARETLRSRLASETSYEFDQETDHVG